MATLCTHCRSPLKDGARYCNLCGTLVPSHPLGPKATSSSSSRAAQLDKPSASMPEQIAQHVSQRPTHFPSQHEPPSWMRELGNSTRTPRNPSLEPQDTNDVPQLDFPAPEAKARLISPLRELRINVWEQDEAAVPLAPENSPTIREMDELDDWPTRPLAAGIPEKTARWHTPIPPANKQQGTDAEELERLDTVPLATHKPLALPKGGPFQHQEDPSRRQRMPTFNSPVNSTSLANPRSPIQPVQDARQTPPPQASVGVPTPSKSRKPFMITLVALFLLVLVGGIGAWVVLYQPFSVPIVTQPEQAFTSSQLGLSLHYPSAWKSQVDQRTATARLYDSTHTAQINIIVSPSHGEDLDQYLRQEASRLGITGQKKNTSLSFAGALWQQLQGSVLLRGASYTETLLATEHHQRLYSIIFLAPQSTYAQEDQLVFLRMRSSFQFLF